MLLHMFRRSPAILIVTLAAIVVPPGSASSSVIPGEVSYLTPASGAHVPRGRPLTFKARVALRSASTAPAEPIGGTPSDDTYQVFLRVSTTPARNRDKLIGHQAYIDVMRQITTSGSAFRLTVPVHEFPKYWLNHPGTYYWQTYYILCARPGKSCVHAGVPRKLYVD
jgi:hypothetical protein